MAMPVKHANDAATGATACARCASLRTGLPPGTDWAALLSHLADTDAFELFGLSPAYALDDRKLADAARAIHRNIHPDRMPRGDEAAQDFALRASAIVNQALATLKDPRLRAEHLLVRAGGRSASEDRVTPPGLLAEMMMIREELEEARAANDAATLARIRADALRRRDETEANITELCENLADGHNLDAVRSSLRMQLNAMKYHENLVKELETPAGRP